VNLGYTKIYAPGEGTVGERQVRPGQLVSPGTQVIAFVDVTKWCRRTTGETQLTNVKIGDPAEVRIDQYPGQVIHGRVLEIAPASGSQFLCCRPTTLPAISQKLYSASRSDRAGRHRLCANGPDSVGCNCRTKRNRTRMAASSITVCPSPIDMRAQPRRDAAEVSSKPRWGFSA